MVNVPDMRVIIHCGMHKTGTTSLQHLLASRRGELAAHGIIYPDTGTEHHNAELYVGLSRWSPDTCLSLVDVAAEQGAHTLLLSGEVASTLSEENFLRLASCFTGHSLTFVVCLRHWSGYLPSRWAQYSSRRDTQTFRKYVDRVAASEHVDHRFDLVLERAAAAAHLIAISYDNAVAEEGSVLPRLMHTLDIPAELAVEPQQLTKRNSRRPWLHTEVLRLMNGFRALRTGLPQDDLFRSLGESRQVQENFDLYPQMNAMDRSLLARLEEVIMEHAYACQFRGIPETEAAEEKLNGELKRYFVNLLGEKVFPLPQEQEFMTSDLTYETLQATAPDLVGQICEAMKLPLFPPETSGERSRNPLTN